MEPLSSIPNGPLKRILVTRTDRLGDLVLSTPVFQALREKFPEAHIACLTFLENRGVVEGNPSLNEVILYDKKGKEKSWLGNLRFARALARKRFDLAIHLHSTHRMHLVSWLAGVPLRVGYRKKSGWALTHTIEDRKGEGLKHEAEYNFDLLKFFGIGLPEKISTYFPLRERDQISLSLLLKNLGVDKGRPYVVLNPSASCPSKIWPADRFARLADQIQTQHGFQIVLIGSKADRRFSLKVKEGAASPVMDLSGKLSLGHLGWFLKGARLLISNDSGPVHVAAAVGTPVISIFGRNLAGLSPCRWGPLGKKACVIHKEVGCPVCLAHNCQINFLCLDVISVEDVLREVRLILQNNVGARFIAPSVIESKGAMNGAPTDS